MFDPDPTLVTLLQATVNSGSSDLHITVGRPPTARRDGTLVSFENVKVLEPEDTERMVMSLLNDEQVAELEHNYQVDFSFGIPGLGRFRRGRAACRPDYRRAGPQLRPPRQDPPRSLRETGGGSRALVTSRRAGRG